MNTLTTAPVLDRLAAIAEPSRARLLALLERNELIVNELCDILQMPQSSVSRHLRVLDAEGWVTWRSEGTSRRYSVATLDDSAMQVWSVVRTSLDGTQQSVHDTERLRAVLAARRSASREYFESAADEWDATRSELFGSSADTSALLALLDPGLTVGDLGCGTGATAAALSPWVSRVIAVDGSRAMLDAARARLAGSAASNVEFRSGELESLPIDACELDVALLFLVLHHVSDPAAVLREAARVLRPGGRVLVVDMLPHDREEYRSSMGHVWLGFSNEQLEEWLSAAGFGAGEGRGGGGFRSVVLPPDPKARGPVVRVMAGVRADVGGVQPRE